MTRYIGMGLGFGWKYGGSGTPPPSLASQIVTALGGDSNVGGIFLDTVGVTNNGGRAAAWQDARGGVFPTMVEGVGTGPTIAADGLTFDGTRYLSVASALITATDNWAIITIRSAEQSTTDGNQMIASAGSGGASGFGITTCTSAGGPTTGIQNSLGGLVNSVAWISSQKLTTTEAVDISGSHSGYGILADQTLRRLSGSITSRYRGTDIGTAVSTAPSAANAISYIGWNGAHDKYKGRIRAVVFVKVLSDDTVLATVEGLLRTAYGIPAILTSFPEPTTGWIDLATSMPLAGALGGAWTTATAAEGNSPSIVHSVPVVHPDGFTDAGLLDYLITDYPVPDSAPDRNTSFDVAFSSAVTSRYALNIDYSILLDGSVDLTANAAARKQMYVNASVPNAPVFILGGFGGALQTQAASGPVQTNGPNVTTLNYAASHIWYRHNVMMALESAIGALNGYYRVTVNGTLIHQDFNLQISNATTTNGDQQMALVRMGQELDTPANWRENRHIIIHSIRMALIPGR